MGNSTHYQDSRPLKGFNDFVGVPWLKGGCDISGADCWGLFVLVSREVYGLVVNEYNGSKASGDELTAIINDETASSRWDRVDIPRPGDAVVMYQRKTGIPRHIGIFVEGSNILHSPDESGKMVSQIHSVRLLNRAFMRLEYYRYDNSI